MALSSSVGSQPVSQAVVTSFFFGEVGRVVCGLYDDGTATRDLLEKFLTGEELGVRPGRSFKSWRLSSRAVDARSTIARLQTFLAGQFYCAIPWWDERTDADGRGRTRTDGSATVGRERAESYAIGRSVGYRKWGREAGGRKRAERSEKKEGRKWHGLSV